MNFNRIRFYWQIRDLYWGLIKTEIKSERRYFLGMTMFNRFGDRKFGFMLWVG